MLDGNFRWTRDLFTPIGKYAPVFFLEPKDFRTARQSGWSLFKLARAERNGTRAKRYIFPPGWFSRVPGPFMRHLGNEINRWFDAGGFTKRVVVITYPQYIRAVKRCHGARVVYYWSDQFQMYWPRQKEYVSLMERLAVESAELTLCVSESKAVELRTLVPQRAHRIVHIPHGYHPGLLPKKVLTEPGPLPKDLGHIPRPILGHWGQISNNIDFRIVHLAASSLPDASFVFVGPHQENYDSEQRPWFERTKSLPNVHFVGPRPFEKIVDYLQSFDVCMLLYRTDLEFTRVTNPTKLHDYLASTRPIVSTAIPDVVSLYKRLVRVGDSPEVFLEEIRSMLAQYDRAQAEERFAYAAENSWERLAEKVGRLVFS